MATFNAQHKLSVAGELDPIGTLVEYALKKLPSTTDIKLTEHAEVYIKCAAGNKSLSDLEDSVEPYAMTKRDLISYIGGLICVTEQGSPATHDQFSYDDRKAAFDHSFPEFSDMSSEPDAKRRSTLTASRNFCLDDGGQHFLRFAMMFANAGLLEINLRITPKEIRSLESLKLPQSVFQMVSREGAGLILLLGPPGVGKSATAYAIANHHAQDNKGLRIVTIEDPIENTKLADDNDGVTQREVGMDTTDFPAALNDAFRQCSPELLMVSEIRQTVAARLVIEAALSGMKVIATMHGSDTLQGLQKIQSLANPDDSENMAQLLATSLQVIIRQALVPTADEKRNVLVFDTLVVGDKARELIGKRDWTALGKALTDGMLDDQYLTMNVKLAELVASGKVTEGEARRKTTQLNGENGFTNQLKKARRSAQH